MPGTMASSENEGDLEDAKLMQRGRPPWQQHGHELEDRSRTRDRSQGERRRRHRAEREDQRRNAHRPWRVGTVTSSTMSANPARCTRRVTGNPAAVEVDGHMTNLGVQAWHVLLNMVEPTEQQDAVEYGLVTHQRVNLQASLEDMTHEERCHLMSSFLRTIALICSDVADVYDTVLQSATARGSRPEGDGADLMQRFLQKPKDKKQEGRPEMKPAPGSASEQVVDWRGDPYELEVRSLVAALEISSAGVAIRRARALMERLRLRMGPGSLTRQVQPLAIDTLESALVTFLPHAWDEELSSGVYFYAELGASDQDFVDYWWNVVTRRLHGVLEAAGAGPPGSGATSSSSPWVPPNKPDSQEITEEEMQLIAEMEAKAKRDSERTAQEEYAQMVESQEAEDEHRLRQHDRERRAKSYRDWEEWEFQSALEGEQARHRVAPSAVEVVIRGGVTGSTTTQSMMFIVAADQTVCLNFHMRAAANGTAPHNDGGCDHDERSAVPRPSARSPLHQDAPCATDGAVNMQNEDEGDVPEGITPAWREQGRADEGKTKGTDEGNGIGLPAGHELPQGHATASRDHGGVETGSVARSPTKRVVTRASGSVSACNQGLCEDTGTSPRSSPRRATEGDGPRRYCWMILRRVSLLCRHRALCTTFA